MKKTVLPALPLIALIFISLISGQVKITRKNIVSAKSPDIIKTVKTLPELPNIWQNTFGIPDRIIIQRLGIDTNIESVGLDSKGGMDVPQNVYDTAWFSLGPKPGSLGSAVIDGHLDQVTGAPAVFYYLSSLQNGDIITVIDDKDKALNFVIFDKESYPWNNFPLQEVFGDKSEKRLNLITCNGIWDNLNKNYSNRLVIYSRLIKQ